MNRNNIVSIVIPVRNSASQLTECLESIKKQSYKRIEVVVVDSGSRDGTQEIAKKYRATYYNFFPHIDKGMFDAPYKRNYGAKKAKGKYIYCMDADMRLTKDVIKVAVNAMESYDAIIIPEDSIGEGTWARAKNLEKRSYLGDDTVEAPRFVKKKVWDKLGGLDEILGGGGDDWDFYQKLLEHNYSVGRISEWVLHDEGKLSLKKLAKKRFMYGKDSLKYIAKRPKRASIAYFPIRRSYLKHWRLFASRPFDAGAFIIMRFVEYGSGFLGIIYSLIKQ